MNSSEIGARLDYRLLRPDATRSDVEQLSAEALQHALHGVCVSPIHVLTAKRALAGSDVRVVSTVAFPFGASPRAVKRAEASHALVDGADELDLVMAIGALRSGDVEAVREDIACVVEVTGADVVVKVILEVALLTADEVELGATLAVEAGANFVMTSTGFGVGGATVEAVARMRAAVGETVGVAAAGGIRDSQTARRLLDAGANRIATSTPLAILSSWPPAH